MPFTFTTWLATASVRCEPFPGDDIGKVTPVPIPNTVVKLSEPMIVLEGAKVGIARIISKARGRKTASFCRSIPPKVSSHYELMEQFIAPTGKLNRLASQIQAQR